MALGTAHGGAVGGEALAEQVKRSQSDAGTFQSDPGKLTLLRYRFHANNLQLRNAVC